MSGEQSCGLHRGNICSTLVRTSFPDFLGVLHFLNKADSQAGITKWIFIASLSSYEITLIIWRKKFHVLTSITLFFMQIFHIPFKS